MKLQYQLSYNSRVLQSDQQHSPLLRVGSPRVPAYNEVKFSGPGGMQPTATPAAESGALATGPTTPDFFANVIAFVQDNPLPAVLIGIALVLFIVLIILLYIWLRRGRAASVPAYDYSPDDSAWSISSGGGAAPAPGSGMTAVPPAAAGAGATRVIQRLPRHVAMLIDVKNADRRHDLQEATDVGRAQTNTVILGDATVSRKHARIRLEEDDFVLYDLGSANGTFLNGTRINQPIVIKDGDTIRFGEVEFTFKQLS